PHNHSGRRVRSLARGPAASKGVVLLSLRAPKDGHNCIADELLHRSPVRLDDSLHASEVPGEECAHRLGVGRLAQSGRAGDVAEEDGDRLPLLAGWSGSLEGRAAGETEAGAFGVALRAVRTERHVLRLDPPLAEHNWSR